MKCGIQMEYEGHIRKAMRTYMGIKQLSKSRERSVMKATIEELVSVLVQGNSQESPILLFLL